jgi:2'-5' RNA ligase
LFTALDLPEDIVDDLVGLQDDVPNARWVVADNFHVTLRFLGEIDEPTADEVDMQLSEIRQRPFDLRLREAGVFGDKKPHAIWIGVEKTEALVHLVKKVDLALNRAGVKPEKRKYVPHVTLARLGGDVPKGAIRNWVESHNGFSSRIFTVSKFTLFSSHLKHTGALYLPERHYVL